jgi:hypothetical protein
VWFHFSGFGFCSMFMDAERDVDRRDCFPCCNVVTIQVGHSEVGLGLGFGFCICKILFNMSTPR